MTVLVVIPGFLIAAYLLKKRPSADVVNKNINKKKSRKLKSGNLKIKL